VDAVKPPSKDSALRTLTLPAALLKGWDGRGGAALAAARAVVVKTSLFGERTGVHWLQDDLCAILPTAGDPAVYDVAMQVAAELVDGAATVGEADRLGLLVVSGKVAVGPSGVRAAPERLLEDLERRPPELGRDPLWATSLVVSRLEAPREAGRRRIYNGPSGTRVPMLAVGPEDRAAPPWRSPTLFRRPVDGVPRADVQRMIGGDSVEALRITGPPGCGKTRAVHQALEAAGAGTVWARCRPARHRGPSLAAQIVHDLSTLTGEGGGPASETLEQLGVAGPEGVDRLLDPGHEPQAFSDSARMASLVPGWLVRLPQGPGGLRPVLVLDDFHAASEVDQDLAEALVAAAVRDGAFRLVLVQRQVPFGVAGARRGPLGDIAELRVPPMEPDDMERFRRSACKGLSLPDEIADRLLAEAAGNPFAFEEGLTALAERDLIREIHGNLFFRGDREIGFKPSNRLVQHVEAEVLRLGDPAPLRILALAGEPVPDDRVRSAARTAGADVAPGWAAPFLETGLLTEALGSWGTGVTPSCPAWGEALRSVIPTEAARTLRRSLGELLAEQSPSGSWNTYRMLEGSDGAIGPLLAASRDHTAPPGELLAALKTELSRHRSAKGDEETELELLWAMLPLAHRQAGLAESREDLERAVELAADDPKRLIALAGLQAELAEEDGRQEEAETILRRALEQSREVGEGDASGEPARGPSQVHTQALLVLRLARLLARRQRHGESRELLERVIPILDREGLRALAASARFHLGNVALYQNQLEHAMELHSAALAARRELLRPKPIGISLSALGRVALQMGRYTEAVSCYQEAEKVFLACGEDEEASFALLGLGLADGRMGDHVGATKPLRRALGLRESRGDRLGIGLARLALAENHLHLGRPGAALEEVRQAHFDLTFVSADRSLPDAEQLLGRIALMQRDVARARRHLTIALDGHRRHDDANGSAFDLAYLVQAELQRGDQYEISRLVAELDNVAERSTGIERGEMLDLCLYRGLRRLDRHDAARRHLERAYQRLMEKTEHLPPELRHRFLFQVRDHEDIVQAATEEGLAS